MTSSRVEGELREARDALRQQAQTDALTGVSNRRHFLEQAQAVLENLAAQGGRASLENYTLKRMAESYALAYKDLIDAAGTGQGVQGA